MTIRRRPPRKSATTVTAAVVDGRILSIRGQRVMLDRDLAELYGVPTRAVNQAVTRNPRRFPADFSFRLTNVETRNLRSQSGEG